MFFAQTNIARYDHNYYKIWPIAFLDMTLYIYPIAFLITAYLAIRVRKKKKSKISGYLKEIAIVIFSTIITYVVKLESGTWYLTYEDEAGVIGWSCSGRRTDEVWNDWRYLVIGLFVVLMFVLVAGVGRLVCKGKKISIRKVAELSIDTVCLASCTFFLLIRVNGEIYEKGIINNEAITSISLVVELMLFTYGVMRFLFRKRKGRLLSQRVMFSVGMIVWSMCG